MQEMITMYLEDVPEAMTKVEQALETEDTTALKAKYKIKPSMGFMGMMEMQELAGRLKATQAMATAMIS